MRKKNLTHAELLVMKCIWDTPKDLVLSEIVAMVNERYNKDWKPQTVSTYLSHLVQKEFLKMTRNGKIYTYQSLVNEYDYFHKCFANFLCFWGFDSAIDFMKTYVENREKTHDKIHEK